MKRKLLTILACAMACMTSFAQHKQVEIYNIEADIEWAGCTAYAAIDGDLDTYWLTDHPDSTNRSNPCPLDVILTFKRLLTLTSCDILLLHLADSFAMVVGKRLM